MKNHGEAMGAMESYGKAMGSYGRATVELLQ